MVKTKKPTKELLQQKKNTKTCFLITPIGEPNSQTRRRVDQWHKLVYEEALKGKDYKIIRADRISAPGMITRQILELITKADLVIIDLTDFNRNVMYEAAIRHMIAKPHIQISPIGQKFPFDIKDFRNIIYDPMSLEYPKKLSQDLRKSIIEIEKPDYKTPEVLSEKFDLEKVFDDPEKFIELLLKHLQPVIKKSKEGLVEIDSDIAMSVVNNPPAGVNRIKDSLMSAGWPTNFGTTLGFPNYIEESVRCPYCGGRDVHSSLTYEPIGSRHTCQSCNRDFSTF